MTREHPICLRCGYPICVSLEHMRGVTGCRECLSTDEVERLQGVFPVDEGRFWEVLVVEVDGGITTARARRGGLERVFVLANFK